MTTLSQRSSSLSLKTYPGKGTKITEGHFPSCIRPLAVAAKSQMRMKVSFGIGIFQNDVTSNTKLGWDVIKEAASKSASGDIAIKFVNANASYKEIMIKFVCSN